MMINGLGFLSLSASLVLPWALTGLVQGQRITESLVKDVRQSFTAKDLPVPSRKLISAVPTGTTYYVSPNGNDRNRGLTPSSAFRRLQRAADLTNPGDTVLIMNGVYTNANRNGSVVEIKRSGRANAWITYKAYPGHQPKLRLNGWHGVSITDGASYIEVKGLEIIGNNGNVSLNYAKSQRYNRLNPLTNGNCIYVKGKNNAVTHNINIIGNKVHSCGGAGIGIEESDYVKVDNNEVYNNAWYSVYGSSGISLLQARSIDNRSDKYKMFITNNRVYNNRMYIPWYVSGKIEDGQGIIVDKFRNNQYQGRTLIANNISYKNGASGIHMYASDNIDIVNNTAYMNKQTPEVARYGEITINNTANINAFNNILYSERGKPTVQNFDSRRGINFNYNHNANSTNIKVSGRNDTSGDPLFVNSSGGDFKLKRNSPAINSGVKYNGLSTDIEGDPRVQGGATDKGAYEIR
jgi:parallel beta-helix repeat protein